jgi:hypothetical protein
MATQTGICHLCNKRGEVIRVETPELKATLGYSYFWLCLQCYDDARGDC